MDAGKCFGCGAKDHISSKSHNRKVGADGRITWSNKSARRGEYTSHTAFTHPTGSIWCHNSHRSHIPLAHARLRLHRHTRRIPHALALVHPLPPTTLRDPLPLRPRLRPRPSIDPTLLRPRRDPLPTRRTRPRPRRIDPT